MADLDPVDPVRNALTGLASGPGRPAGAVLEDLRPAMGRARLHRRVHVASMTAAAAALVVVGGISLRAPTEAQQVQIADETSGPDETLPAFEVTGVTSSTTLAPSTTVTPTTIASAETSVVSPTSDVVAAPDADPEPATPALPDPAPEPTAVPAATTPPVVPPTSASAPPPPPPGSSQTLVISVSGAGTISVGYTPTTITDVDVSTTGGYTYEIEDRTVHEVKVEFEGGGPKIEVEVHLEDGEITYQIDGDESES